MVWVRKADLRSKVPGPRGEQGLPGVNAVENDTAVAAYVDSESLTRNTLLKNGLTGWLHLDGFGGDPTGLTKSTDAFLAAIDAAVPGDTIYLGATGSGAGYDIDGDTIVITKPSLRILAAGRDAYATSIRCSDTGTTMFTVKAAGFVMQGIGLWGDGTMAGPGGGANGVDSTIIGLKLMGDADGNVDAAIRSCAFQYLALGARLYGRNVEISENTLFSNCLDGIRHAGKDVTYHTGPGADQNRGHVIRDSRFHNIGTSPVNVGIEFTPDAKLLHTVLDGNHFDSGGLGRHIVIAGTTVDPARGVSIFNSKHTELSADGITLINAQYPIVNGVQLMGVGTGTGHGIVLDQCLYPVISSAVIRLVGKHGIVGTNNDGASISDTKIIQVGQDPTFVGSALAFDSSNVNIRATNVQGHTGDGYFFSGSPGGADSALIDCSYNGFSLGGINSTTLLNHSKRGQNSYVEGRWGRVEDTGYGQYDLTAGVAKKIADVALGGNYGSFILEIEASGRDSSSFNAYFAGKRVVRPENGTHSIITLGTDATSGMTVTVVGAGAQGVSVNVQTATATFIGVKVRAVAAGAASATSSRSVGVTMVTQP
ncbi:hypothetical protein [Microbacterium algeriense]|uniref:Right handed beta helix domain-containing protein n=1 Tax=Microbacterium algeriense TaxID=2615184 RepID=A0ABQ6VG90_9MICO|nr:hypothetical protein [Microbacterium algeriense]KAB1867344.1 hypothetical protein F6A08_06035 [Microbacterium algeriense]